MAFSREFLLISEVVEHVQIYARRLFTSSPRDVLSRFEDMEYQFMKTFCDPEPLDHSPVILIRRNSKGSPIVRRYSHGTLSSMPWGIPLPPCDSCKTAVNIRTEYQGTLSQSVKLLCHGCGRKCVYKKPEGVENWNDKFSVKDYSNFWVSPFPLKVNDNVWFDTNKKRPREPSVQQLEKLHKKRYLNCSTREPDV